MKTVSSKESPIYLVEVVPPNEAGGWVVITLAPGKKDTGKSGIIWRRDLGADLDRIKDQGITTLVPLLTDEELARLEIPDLVAEARARGLEVWRFPFHDAGIPASMEQALGFVRELCSRYAGGERLLVHCNGGLGRAGTIAACVRLALGLDGTPDQAVSAVRKARSPRAIENPEQEEFVREFHGAWKKSDSSLSEPRSIQDLASRRRGAWFGLAIGDALGAPVEFMSPEQIAATHGLWKDMGESKLWRKGEWTDDTALALAAAAAYSAEEFELDLAAQAMVEWLETKPKDVGGLTRLALELIRDKRSSAGQAGKEALCLRPGAAGNGSLMRAAPTGLVRGPRDPRLAEESEELSRITHADERCVDACIAFNAVLSSLVHQGPDVEQALRAALLQLKARNHEVQELVKGVLRNDPPRHAESSIGYVLLCLERALIALRDAPSFEEGLIQVVNQGGDTDTNAAVAGALLGARFGHNSIPARWIHELLGKDVLEQGLVSLERFVEQSGPEFEIGPDGAVGCYEEPETHPGNPIFHLTFETSMEVQARASLARKKMDRDYGVAIKIISVQYFSDEFYRFIWKVGCKGEKDFMVSAYLDAGNGNYYFEEPLSLWSEVWIHHRGPEGLEGEELNWWLINYMVHGAMKRALASMVFTMDVASKRRELEREPEPEQE